MVFEGDSQSEHLVPLRVEVFVNGVRLQSVIVQLHYTERVALPWGAPVHINTVKVYPREHQFI